VNSLVWVEPSILPASLAAVTASSTHGTQPGGSDVERTIGGVDSAAAVSIPLAPPERGYRVERLLGKGGEGEVHQALQLAFGRAVAVKSLRNPTPDPRQIRRFRAEAAVTALLEHPNIIPVHDLRVAEDDRLQLVMKRVSGQTWRGLLDGAPPGPGRRPLNGEEHIEVLLKVCDAVSFAHSRGILHRDLKPENVMVGEHGEVLVMDWGCACHVGPTAPHPDIPVLTALSGVSGTPAYVSPEQARGEHAACGAWTDVYLLGGILYRMLTGSPPHRATGVQQAIAQAARGEPVEDPSQRAGRKVPGELARIAMDALHPDPARRLRTVSEIATAIRRYVEHREVHRLLAEARRQHELGKAGGADSDDAYRRAIGAVEQAVQLWPEQATARRLFVEIGLDSARHAIAAGSFRVGRRQAQAVVAESERLGDGANAETATKIVALADLRDRQARGREAQARSMRRLAVGGAVVAGLALVVGLLAVWRESTQTAQALAAAQANLERAEQERAARVEGERLAAPALLSQARELALQRKYDEGLQLALAAQGFAPEDAAAPLIAAQLLIAAGRRTEAITALDQALALRPDPLVGELRQLCLAPPADADARIAETLVRLGAGAMTGGLNLAAEKKAQLARSQLTASWPKLAPRNITALPDGTLTVRLSRGDCEIDSLEPLRGLPISNLDLSGQDRVRDLAPLASLPLTSLILNGCAAKDLAPLAGLRLRRLSAGTHVLDAADRLHGMPLEALDLTWSGQDSLAALAGLPLRELRLYGCDVLADISAAAAMPLEVLALEANGNRPGGPLNDLRPLRGKPLRDLSLLWQRGVTELAPLQGAPLGRVALTGTAIANLAPIAQPALRSLLISETAVAELKPLLGLQLDTLELSPQRIRSPLADLRRITSLRLVNGLARDDFIRWCDLQRAIVAANPDYAWNGRAVYKDGKPSELRFSSGLRTADQLRGLPLSLLELSYCQVADLAPLAGLPLIELNLSRNKASDLRPLAGLRSLRRLNLVGCPVEDLRPLAKLQLESIAFSPRAKLVGVEVLRGMSTLKHLSAGGPSLSPTQFWSAWDRGEIK